MCDSCIKGENDCWGSHFNKIVIGGRRPPISFSEDGKCIESIDQN